MPPVQAIADIGLFHFTATETEPEGLFQS